MPIHNLLHTLHELLFQGRAGQGRDPSCQNPLSFPPWNQILGLLHLMKAIIQETDLGTCLLREARTSAAEIDQEKPKVESAVNC